MKITKPGFYHYDGEEKIEALAKRDVFWYCRSMHTGRAFILHEITEVTEWLAEPKNSEKAEKIKPEIPPKTLRDEYAMAALTGLLANPDIIKVLVKDGAPLRVAMDMSFEAADEAMKRREKP